MPQESASSIAALYVKYEPFEVKNLYPDSRITTFIVALPNAAIASIARARTDGMRVDNTIISVERYNPRQSTVARRETRRTNSGLYDQGYDDDEYGDEYEGYEGDASGLAEEMVSSRAGEAIAFVETGAVPPRKVEGVSWADITRGVASVSSSASPATPTVSEPLSSAPEEEELLSAFDSGTPVDRSSHFPPPSDRSHTSSPIISSLTTTQAPGNRPSLSRHSSREEPTSSLLAPAKHAQSPEGGVSPLASSSYSSNPNNSTIVYSNAARAQGSRSNFLQLPLRETSNSSVVASTRPTPALGQRTNRFHPARGTFTSPVTRSVKPAAQSAARFGPPQTVVTAATAPVQPRVILPLRPLSRRPLPETVHVPSEVVRGVPLAHTLAQTPPPQPQPSESSDMEETSGQATAVSETPEIPADNTANTVEQRHHLPLAGRTDTTGNTTNTRLHHHSSLTWRTDSTENIRNRHSAGCSFCQKRMQGHLESSW